MTAFQSLLWGRGTFPSLFLLVGPAALCPESLGKRSVRPHPGTWVASLPGQLRSVMGAPRAVAWGGGGEDSSFLQGSTTGQYVPSPP